MIEHELDGVQLDEFADGGVADGEIVEELQRLRDDRFTRTPEFQVGDDLLNDHGENLKGGNQGGDVISSFWDGTGTAHWNRHIKYRGIHSFAQSFTCTAHSLPPHCTDRRTQLLTLLLPNSWEECFCL